MTDTPRPRSLLARIRDRLATDESDPEPLAEPAPDAVTEPPRREQPPRREHLYGSTYRVRMSFDELMTERGRIGTAGMYRRSIAQQDDARRDARRRTAAERAGYTPGEVLWPSVSRVIRRSFPPARWHPVGNMGSRRRATASAYTVSDLRRCARPVTPDRLIADRTDNR